LHADVDFGEEFVYGSWRENVNDAGEVALDVFVEGSKIRDPSYFAVFFWDQKCRCGPFRTSSLFEDAQ
jgi:hypothetical protein